MNLNLLWISCSESSWGTLSAQRTANFLDSNFECVNTRLPGVRKWTGPRKQRGKKRSLFPSRGSRKRQLASVNRFKLLGKFGHARDNDFQKTISLHVATVFHKNCSQKIAHWLRETVFLQRVRKSWKTQHAVTTRGYYGPDRGSKCAGQAELLSGTYFSEDLLFNKNVN